ncbi:sugar transferase [Azospirillum sp. sgz302134]
MHGGDAENERTLRALRIKKRAFDLVCLLLTAPFWLPLLLVLACLVKLEHPSVPALFRQKRTGYLGQSFTMYKFRTMVPNAEAMKASLMAQNELKWPDFKIKDDPRITPLGSFLRKVSLDELPQLLNVLKGDMSLVGPRPTSFQASTYESWQKERLVVHPGITGLAQVIDRDGMEFGDRVRYDLTYIRNRCMVLDLIILYRTFAAAVRGH